MKNTAKEMTQFQFDLNQQLAQENRDWQERLANSAHQREIADLKKAGLNPVLSIHGGNGANTPSGSTASVSDGAGYFSALANLEAARINSATQMYMHDTPSANSMYGQVRSFYDLSGRSLEEDLPYMIGSFIDGMLGKPNQKADNIFFGLGDDLNAIYDKYTNWEQQNFNNKKMKFETLLNEMKTAQRQGKVSKYYRLKSRFDGLAYYHPEAYKEVFGKAPAVHEGMHNDINLLRLQNKARRRAKRADKKTRRLGINPWGGSVE